MPRGDETGPDGQGKRTGRGLGRCDPDKTDGENASTIGHQILSRRGGGRVGRAGSGGGRSLNRRSK